MVKGKANEEIRDRGHPVQKEWKKRDGKDSLVPVNIVFDRLQKDLEVNDDRDKIVDDIPVENGELVAELEVDMSNFGAGLTLTDYVMDIGVTLNEIVVEEDEKDIEDATVQVQ